METTQPGMVGGLQALAYGEGNPTPMGGLAQLVKGLVPSPEQQRANEWLAFAGGINSPNTSGGSGLGGGIAAVATDRLERDKLMAQYVPLIANAIVQNQQMTLAASNASREFLKDVNPKIDTQLAAMRTGNATPTYAEAVQRIIQLGQEYQVPANVLFAKINSLPSSQEDLAAHLDRLAVANAGADKLLPSVGSNAAGQTVGVSPVRGTMRVIGGEQPTRGAPGANSNPSKAEATFEESARGDPKSYEDAIRFRLDAYQTMATRMNEQAEYVKNFQPGRYARMAGGLAAAITDIAARIPSIDKATVESLAKRFLAAPEGSKDSLAAQQLFEQLAQQETIAQLKTTLGEGQRMNQSEYQQFQAVNKGQAMDPATFEGLRKFLFTQLANEANKYRAWATYVTDPAVARRSVTDFDAAYAAKRFDKLLAGDRGVADEKGLKPTYDAPKPAAPAAVSPAPAPANVDLKQYEPGARVGPTGAVYVMDKGQPRVARRLADAAPTRPAPRPEVVNGVRLADMQPTLQPQPSVAGGLPQ